LGVLSHGLILQGGWTQLGRLRVQIAEALAAKGELELTSDPHFLWVTQFPLFTLADEDKAFLSKGRWASSHHPFTAPMFEDLEALKKGNVEGVGRLCVSNALILNEQVRGQHYDLVLNGQEIGGGSVRIHDANLQEYIMKEILKVSGTCRLSLALTSSSRRVRWRDSRICYRRSSSVRPLMEALPSVRLLPHHSSLIP
jgi:aspartyl-tRNA synthetase